MVRSNSNFDMVGVPFEFCKEVSDRLSPQSGSRQISTWFLSVAFHKMPRQYGRLEQSGDGYSDDGFDQEGSHGYSGGFTQASSTPKHTSSRQSLSAKQQQSPSHDEYEDSKFEEPAPQGPSEWAKQALPDADTIQTLQEQLRRRRLGSGGQPEDEPTMHPRAGRHTVHRGRSSLVSINIDFAGKSIPSQILPSDTALESAAYQRACQVARDARGQAAAPPSPVQRPASAGVATSQQYIDRLSAPKWHPEGWGTAQASLVPQLRAARKLFPFKPSIPKASRRLAARTSNGAPFLERLEQHERERLNRLATQRATIAATGAAGGGVQEGKGPKSKWSAASWQRVQQQQEERKRKIRAQWEALYGDMGRPLTRWTDTDQRAAAPPVAWEEVKEDFLARMDDAAASKHELREALAEKGRSQRSRY